MAITVLVVITAVLAYGFAETYWIRVKEYTFTDPDLPTEFDGARIVLLSDIHRGPFFSRAGASLVERANALEPDLLVLGGTMYLWIPATPNLVSRS